MVSGHPKSTGILWVDGLSTGPPDLGVSHFYYVIFGLETQVFVIYGTKVFYLI